MIKSAALPKGIVKGDLVRPSFRSRTKMAREDGHPYGPRIEFDLWYTERFGWVIPTLLITRRRLGIDPNHSGGERTYAVAVKDGGTLTCGNGPHVKERVRVYVKASRLKALSPFLALLAKGRENANQIRDSISTRRVRALLRR